MPLEPAELDDLGVLRIRGPDAVPFLQGQLSNDLERLVREGSLLAGFHNPQGRTIAILRLLLESREDILAVLPSELAAAVAARLARFVLRAKVRITDDSASWRVRGVVQDAAPGGLAARVADAPTRWLIAVPRAPEEPPVPGTGGARRAWRLLDVAAGLPQVYARTSELYVGQMLNLDLIDGISFSKGCYTGQEVIARAHYRGRVKRRMQRWRTLHASELAPGDAARLGDGRALQVVEAAELPDGRRELLAVAALTTDGEPGESEGASTRAAPSPAAPSPAAPSPAAPEARSLLEAEQLPLPYALPS